MLGIHGMVGTTSHSRYIGNVEIVESLSDTFARQRADNVHRYQCVLMDSASSEEQRLAARRQLIMLRSDPGPARTDAECAADEQAKVDLKFARRADSHIYRAQREIILDWMSTDDERRAARALLTRMFGSLDDDLMESAKV